MRILPLLLLLVGATCGPLSAQVVRGEVVEEGSDTPLVGAMVILLVGEDGDAVADRVLTDAAGSFTMDARSRGLHRIRVDRIGYASLTTEPFDVPREGALRRIEVPIEPVRLRGLDVSGERRCEVRPEEGRVTARVWEEARKSLAAAAWTLESGLYRYTLLKYERSLDRGGDEIIEESRSFTRGWTVSPFVSAPIEELVSEGFVQEHPDSGTIYHAPDAEAFLSRAFLDTHCLGVRPGAEDVIGLSFEPVEGRDQTDIAGVLWLDAESAELRRLDFEYVNLRRYRDLGEPGGEVVFTRLPSGAWIVREWRIRMPVLARVGRVGVRRVGYRDEGGLAWRVTDRDGDIVLEAGTASISGNVVDSIRPGPPERPVRVEVADLSESVESRPDGSFVLPGLPEGRHELRVRHELLDTLGIAAPSVRVQSLAGEVVHATLRVPTLADALAAGCGGPVDGARSAAVLGRVISESDTLPPGLTVELRWLATPLFQPDSIAVPAGPGGEAELRWTRATEGAYAAVQTELDERGIFVLCEVPHGSSLRLSLTAPPDLELSERITVPFGADVVIETIDIRTRRVP